MGQLDLFLGLRLTSVVVRTLVDIVGRRFMFLGGVTLFAVASVLVASAESSSALIGAMGSAGYRCGDDPAVVAVGAQRGLPRQRTGRSHSPYGAQRSAEWRHGSAGRRLAHHHASWHWAFLINVPIALAVFIGVLPMVPETKDTTHRRGIDVPRRTARDPRSGCSGLRPDRGPELHWLRPKKQFEAAGFTWPLDNVSPAFVSLVLSALLLLGFVWFGRRRKAAGQIVLLDLGLFRIKTFGMGNAVAALVSLGEFGLLFILPLFLQSVIGYDARWRPASSFWRWPQAPSLASGLGAPGQTVRPGPCAPPGHGTGSDRCALAGADHLRRRHGLGDGPRVVHLWCWGRLRDCPVGGVILSEVPIAESGQASAAVDVTTGWRGHRHRAAGSGADHRVRRDQGRPHRPRGFRRGGRPGHDLRSAECWHGRGGAASATRRGRLVQGGASEGFATAVRGVGFLAAGLISLGLLAAFFLPFRNAAQELKQPAAGVAGGSVAAGNASRD